MYCMKIELQRCHTPRKDGYSVCCTELKTVYRTVIKYFNTPRQLTTDVQCLLCLVIQAYLTDECVATVPPLCTVLTEDDSLSELHRTINNRKFSYNTCSDFTKHCISRVLFSSFIRLLSFDNSFYTLYVKNL